MRRGKFPNATRAQPVVPTREHRVIAGSGWSTLVSAIAAGRVPTTGAAEVFGLPKRYILGVYPFISLSLRAAPFEAEIV